jgi:hypothetical protein
MGILVALKSLCLEVETLDQPCSFNEEFTVQFSPIKHEKYNTVYCDTNNVIFFLQLCTLTKQKNHNVL